MSAYSVLRLTLMSLLLWLPPSGHTSTPVSETEAIATIAAYGDALKSGDIGQLRTLVGNPLLDKRSRLWSTEAYGQVLTDTYANSNFSIVGISTQSNGQAVVGLQIETDGSRVKKLLTISRLDSGIRIVDERMAENQGN